MSDAPKLPKFPTGKVSPPAQAQAPARQAFAPKNPRPQADADPPDDGAKVTPEGHKPTAEEELEREDFIYDLLAQYRLKSTIKRLFMKKFKCNYRTVEKYLARARARMKAEYAAKVNEGTDLLKMESVNFYRSVIRDPAAMTQDKIRAQERLDKLFGLDMPVKVAPTTPDGKEKYENLTGAELDARILELLAAQGQS